MRKLSARQCTLNLDELPKVDPMAFLGDRHSFPKNTAHLLVHQLASLHLLLLDLVWSSCHSTLLFCCDQLPSQHSV